VQLIRHDSVVNPSFQVEELSALHYRVVLAQMQFDLAQKEVASWYYLVPQGGSIEALDSP
jgi:hypothetical protein